MEAAIEAPRIAVTTQGPEQWSVVARNLPAAKQVKGQLEEDGLDCSSIEERKQGYAFRVEANNVVDGLGIGLAEPCIIEESPFTVRRTPNKNSF